MKITNKAIKFTVDTVNELLTITGEENQVIVVSDENRGGTFIYRSAKSTVNDGGVTFNGWCRQFSGAVTPEMFGAKGDGITDDTLAMNKALIMKDVRCVNGRIYKLGRLNITSNTTIDLNQSTILRNTEILDGGTTLWSNDTFIIYINSAIVLYNITIKNGTIDDKHTESLTTYRAFFGINTGGGVVNLKFDNLIFKDSHSGIYSSNLSAKPAVSNSSFINCSFYNPNPVDVGVATVSTLTYPYSLVAITHAEHVLIDNCYIEYSFHGVIINQNDNALPFKNNNVTISNCRVNRTIDSSLYYYASDSNMTGNYIYNPGKDGIKINTTLLSTSERNKIIGNTIDGAPAQHQADGSCMVVMVGGSNIFSNNTINMYGTTQHSVNPNCIAVDGEHSIISNNIINSSFVNSIGINLYVVAYSNTPKRGIIVSGNTFEVKGNAISIDADKQTHFSIVNNIFKTYNTALSFNFPTTQSIVRIPVYSNISGNTFYSMLSTSKHIYNQNVDRVSFNNNIFLGNGQRDMQPASNVGAWIGCGNMSEGINDPVYISYVVKNRGANNLFGPPTSGTYKKGEIVGGDSLGYRCTQSGTLGTITGVTASTTAGSPNIIVNIDKIIYPGMYITISGESGIFTVKDKSGFNITLMSNVANTATSASVQYSPATFTTGSEFYV